MKLRNFVIAFVLVYCVNGVQLLRPEYIVHPVSVKAEVASIKPRITKANNDAPHILTRRTNAKIVKDTSEQLSFNSKPKITKTNNDASHILAQQTNVKTVKHTSEQLLFNPPPQYKTIKTNDVLSQPLFQLPHTNHKVAEDIPNQFSLIGLTQHPEALLSMLSSADPEKIDEIIGILEGLIQANQAKMSELNEGVTSCELTLNEKITLVNEKTADVNAAEAALDLAEDAKIRASQAHLGATSNKDSQLPGLVGEITTLKSVIHILEEMLPALNRLEGGCDTATSKDQCISSSSGSTDTFGQPCMWCCGKKCFGDISDTYCQPRDWLMEHDDWIGEAQNSWGYDTCP